MNIKYMNIHFERKTLFICVDGKEIKVNAKHVPDHCVEAAKKSVSKMTKTLDDETKKEIKAENDIRVEQGKAKLNSKEKEKLCKAVAERFLSKEIERVREKWFSDLMGCLTEAAEVAKGSILQNSHS